MNGYLKYEKELSFSLRANALADEVVFVSDQTRKTSKNFITAVNRSQPKFHGFHLTRWLLQRTVDGEYTSPFNQHGSMETDPPP